MSYIKTGTCNQCGDCCKPLIMQHPPMLNDDKTQCKYLIKDGEVYKCPIFAGELSKEDIPERDWKYFISECLDYPEAVPTHTLSPRCGYEIKEVT